jgi:hypothetical protein
MPTIVIGPGPSATVVEVVPGTPFNGTLLKSTSVDVVIAGIVVTVPGSGSLSKGSSLPHAASAASTATSTTIDARALMSSVGGPAGRPAA